MEVKQEWIGYYRFKGPVAFIWWIQKAEILQEIKE
jgi:hypothetical protein